jgi:hypothetical protein
MTTNISDTSTAKIYKFLFVLQLLLKRVNKRNNIIVIPVKISATMGENKKTPPQLSSG